MSMGITGGFGILGENWKRRRVINFCGEKGLCVGNTNFEHNSLHKYTRVARDQDGMKVMSMIIKLYSVKLGW